MASRRLRKVCSALKDQGEFVVYLDGDLLREAFGSEYGYDRATRQMLSFKYARLSKMLADQGATVVGAFIAMFHELHAWNRDNIENYYEIFVEVPMENYPSVKNKCTAPAKMATKVMWSAWIKRRNFHSIVLDGLQLWRARL